MQARENELSTEVWKKVLDEASSLGILQLHLTGGEPTARDDLLEIIRYARTKNFYTNLITSGITLTPEKIKALVDAGLDHVQLSFQDSQETRANEFAGTKAHALKIKVAKWIRESSLAFTMNIVIHRQNVDRLAEMIQLGEDIGADRLEIAHVQYYGWAFKNRALLIPTLEQVRQSIEVIQSAKVRLKDKIRIDFVLPDYYAKYPKPCMGGWAQKSLVIDPAGRVMPCHAAMVIPGLQFENVTEKSLKEIWEASSAFQKFRGTDWMQEPCVSCDRKEKDFGGCRCQAFLLAGDAAATDPVCSLSPLKKEVEKVLASTSVDQNTSAESWSYRKI